MPIKKKVLFFLLLLLVPTSQAFADENEILLYESFYGNGQMAYQYYYYVHCLEWSEDGSYCASGQWRKHGDYTHWWDDGKKDEEAVFEHDVRLRSEKWGYFWTEDYTIRESLFSRNQYKYTWGVSIKDGTHNSWFRSGNVRTQNVYENGVLTVELQCFEDGDIQEKGTYVNGVKHGEFVETSISSAGTGKTIIRSWHGTYEDGLKQGVWDMYYEYLYYNITRYLQTRGHYVDDIKHGSWTQWYPQSEIDYQGSYNQGNKHGAWIWGEDDGVIYTRGSYDNGYKTGTWIWSRPSDTTFFSIDMYGEYGPPADPILEVLRDDPVYYSTTGIIRIQAEYNQNLLDGQCLMWYEGNGKAVEGVFKSGLTRHGLWTAWNVQGNTYIVALFNNGVESSRKAWQYQDYPPHTPYFLSTYQEYIYRKHHGAYRSYASRDVPCGEGLAYTKGTLTSKGSYSNGSQCGNWSTLGIGSECVPEWSEPYYNGPCSPAIPGDMPSDPEAKTVKGWVIDEKTGEVLSGTSISIAGENISTDSNGTYNIVLDGSTGLSTLRGTKTAYADFRTKIDFTQVQHKIVNIKLKKVAEKPVITAVSSKYGRIFIEGININNEYSASVFWQGQDPGQVKFDKNGTIEMVAGNEDGGVKTYNMGSDFISSLSASANDLRISAIVDPEESDVVVLHPIVIPVPDWSVSMGVFGNVEYGEGVASYSMEKSWPDPPLEIEINQRSVSGAVWTAWGFFPLIGGRDFGIIETQATVGIEANTLGEGSVQLAGQTGFTAAGQSIVGKIEGLGNLHYMSGQGLEWLGAEFTLGVEGSIKKEVGPISLIPALENAENWFLVGRPIKWFNSKAVIKGQIDAGAQVKLIMVVNEESELEFDKAEGEIMSGITLGLALEICKGLSASIEGGAKITVFLVVPADPEYLEKIEATLFAKLQLVVLGYEKNWEGEHTFPESQAKAQKVLDDGGFMPVSREFLNLGGYNLLAATNPAIRMKAAAGVDERKVIDNVFPHSSPVIAEKGDGQHIITYVYTDPNDPVLQSMEIYYTIFNGATYTTPLAIIDDTRSDFNPVTAYDSNGNLVAVWERVKDENFSGQLEAMVPELEIVWSVYQSGSWSVPVALTDNQYIDHAPILVESSTKDLLLIWRSNADNEFFASVAKPDTIHYATWNGSGFSSVSTLATQIADSFKLSLAYHTDNGVTSGILAYNKDMDGDFATHDDEIFYHTFDGSSWSQAVALTTDVEWMDINPEVAYKNDGTPELVWLKQKHIAGSGEDDDTFEGKLVRLTDWQSGAFETIRDGSTSVTFTDFHFFAGGTSGNERLALVWQDIGANNLIDLFYSTYDENKNVWSKDLRLTDDAMTEKGVNGTIDDSGKLFLVFNKVIGDGTYMNQAVKNDLYSLSYEFINDLELIASGLSVAVGIQPDVATTLTATVLNKGNFAQEDVPVAFYIGDPDNGGVLIDTGVITGTLIAGDQGEATVQWTATADDNLTEIFAVVDPAGVITESLESNNKASFVPVMMDLELVRSSASLHANGDIEIYSIVRNNGFFAAEGYHITYTVDGEEISAHMGFPIQPGLTAELVHLIMPGEGLVSLKPEIQITIGPEDRVRETAKRQVVLNVTLLKALQAVVLSLQVMTGQNPEDAQYVTDINHDGQIDLAETIFFLQQATMQ